MNKKYTIQIFSFTTGLLWFSLYAYVAELSTYADTLGANYKMIGFITGSYGLTQLLLRIPLGMFSDHIGKRKVFVHIGLFVAIISAIVTFIRPSPGSLLVTRALAGVTASTWVIYTVMFSSYFPKEKATKAIGIINSVNAIGQLSSMVIGGLVSMWFGTRYLFLLAAIGGIIGLLASFLIKKEQPLPKKAVHFSSYTSVLKNKQLQVVSVLGILSQLITFATAFGFVPILGKRLGATDIQLSILTALAVIPAVFVSRLAGDFFPRVIGKKRTLEIGFLMSAIFCIVLPMIPNLLVLYVVQFLSGIGRSLVFPLLMGMSIEEIEPDRRATAMGVFQAVYGVGMVVGPVLLGAIADGFGLMAGFTVTGILGIVGLLIIHFRREIKR